MSVLVPVANLPYLEVDNLQVAWASNTTLTMAAGRARADDNINDIVLSTGVTINTAVVGANGIDTGVLQASKHYYVYVISSSYGTVAPVALISLSATPYMPDQYDSKRLIAHWRTDASVHFIKGYVVGNGKYRTHFFDDIIKVQNDGTSATLALIDLDTAVPPVQNTPVLIQDEFTPATANDYVTYVPGDSTATVGQRTYGSVAAKMNGGMHEVLSRLSSSKAQIKYINSAASCNLDLWVAGFRYVI
jgi:hypothetical protein